MEALEEQVQKNLLNFCKILPLHVEKWRSIIRRLEIPIRSLLNLCGQLRRVAKSNLMGIEDFENLQTRLSFQVVSRAEEEIAVLKGLIDEFHSLNNEVQNKLIILEKSTLNLDWTDNSNLVHGSWLQPRLLRLLQNGLQFVNIFLKSAKEMNNSLKLIDLNDYKSIKRFELAHCIDMNSPVINQLITLTLYVNNEKDIF